MADESSHLPNDQNLDYHIVTLIERLDGLRKDPKVPSSKMSMQTELRTLTFWR